MALLLRYIIALMAAATFDISAEAAAPPKKLPPQGLYDACMPQEGEPCRSHLTKMAAGGFKVVLNYGNLYGSSQNIVAYADKAQSLGMKVIWSLKDPGWYDGSNTPLQEYGWLIDSCGGNCNTVNALATYFINLVKNHPATMGYYVADEPDPFTNLDLTVTQVESWNAFVKAADQTHPTTLGHWYQYWDCTIRLRPFVDAADWLGLDIYAFLHGRTESDVAQCSAAGQQLVNQNTGKTWWVILEAQKRLNGAWDPDNGVMPTRDQMRKVRDAAIANSKPGVIMWWWYPDAASTSQGWNDLVWAAGAR